MTLVPTPTRAGPLLGARLGVLAGLIVLYVTLGPLVLDVIHFQTSASGLNQIRGGDLAALAVVVPVCLVVGLLARRGHPAAPVLALAPAGYAVYMYSQLAIGNEYTTRPGNVAAFLPLFAALVAVAAVVVVTCWRGTDGDRLPVTSRRLERGSGVLLLVIAVLVVLGIHLPTLVAVLSDPPTSTVLLDTPITFWVVKVYDLGFVAPAALVVGTGLLRRRTWARKPAYAILGGYVLLGCSVAGMAWNMLIQDDPDASLGLALGMTGVAIAGAVFGYFLYRPLFGVPERVPAVVGAVA